MLNVTDLQFFKVFGEAIASVYGCSQTIFKKLILRKRYNNFLELLWAYRIFTQIYGFDLKTYIKYNFNN
jgi:hypothetical protein